MAVTAHLNHNALGLIAYKYKISTHGKLIYIVTVLAVFFALSALPFIYIGISINSPGLIQADIEKTELLSAVNGRIIFMQMKDNQAVSSGDTLMLIDASLPGKQSQMLQERFLQLDKLLQDVNTILNAAESVNEGSIGLNLSTGQYKTSWRHYLQEYEDKMRDKNQMERIFRRYEDLYANNVLSIAEYEKFKFDYEQAVSALSLLTRRYKAQWQLEAGDFREVLNRIEGQQAENTEQKRAYILRATVNGSLQNLSG